MEKWFLIIAAVLLILYFIFTETLDWVGRLEVIRQYFPKFPEFLERRVFRVIILLVAIALLIRVATEHGSNKTGVSSVPTDVHTQPVTIPTPTVVPITPPPSPAVTKIKPKPKPLTPAPSVDTPAAASEQPKQVAQNCPNGICIGGENSGSPTVNNFGPPPVSLSVTWGLSPDPLSTCTGLTTNVTITPNQAVSPPVQIAFDVDTPVLVFPDVSVKDAGVVMGGGATRRGMHPMVTLVSPGITPQNPAVIRVCTRTQIVQVSN